LVLTMSRNGRDLEASAPTRRRHGATARDLLEGAAETATSLGRPGWMQPSESDLHELEGMVEIVNAPAGTRLLSEGQPVDFVASVQRGEIELYRLAGRHRVVFEIVRQGDLFGVPPFLSAEPAAYTARAVTPTTLLLIETSDLERLLVSRPAVARAFIWALVRRMERCNTGSRSSSRPG
jgi:CRP/FNR family transcriptional regulator, cAMP and macrophage regulator